MAGRQQGQRLISIFVATIALSCGGDDEGDLFGKGTGGGNTGATGGKSTGGTTSGGTSSGGTSSGGSNPGGSGGTTGGAGGTTTGGTGGGIAGGGGVSGGGVGGATGGTGGATTGGSGGTTTGGTGGTTTGGTGGTTTGGTGGTTTGGTGGTTTGGTGGTTTGGTGGTTTGGTGGTATGGTGGTATGGTGGTATGGTGGTATGGTGGVGGTGATGGTGGTGGTPSCPPTGCGAGQYCATNTNTCSKCNDFTRFEFGTPTKITTVSASGNQRFPRVTHNNPEMFWRAGAGNVEKQLYLTPNYQIGSGSPIGAPVDVSNLSESGPLEAIMTSGLLFTSNFFFDRTTTDIVTGDRTIYGASRSGTTFSTVVGLPFPINTLTSSNYSIAIAATALRAWWMTDRNGSFQLVTFNINGVSAASPAVVNITLPNGCPRNTFDSTPWVTPDGTVMLFSSLEVDSQCNVTSDTRNLYFVRLGSTGLPTGPATSLGVSFATWDDTDPSLGSDFCYLFFASDEGPGVREYDLYRVQRD